MSNLKKQVTKETKKETKEEGVNIIYNKELVGIELYFNTKPNDNILNALRYNKLRWNNTKKCWYFKDTPEHREFIKTLTGDYNLKKETSKKAKEPTSSRVVIEKAECVNYNGHIYQVTRKTNSNDLILEFLK